LKAEAGKLKAESGEWEQESGEWERRVGEESGRGEWESGEWESGVERGRAGERRAEFRAKSGMKFFFSNRYHQMGSNTI
jgi:hypothetical protein